MIAFRSGSKDDADTADVPSPGSNIPASIRAFVQRVFISSHRGKYSSLLDTPELSPQPNRRVHGPEVGLN